LVVDRSGAIACRLAARRSRRSAFSQRLKTKETIDKSHYCCYKRAIVI